MQDHGSLVQTKFKNQDNVLSFQLMGNFLLGKE